MFQYLMYFVQCWQWCGDGVKGESVDDGVEVFCFGVDFVKFEGDYFYWDVDLCCVFVGQCLYLCGWVDVDDC